jgi:Fe-S cluster assembly protein SufD
VSAAETYSEKYKAIPQREFPVLQDLAMEHFSRLGFPTSKNEEWKYTSIAPIISGDFSFSVPEKKYSAGEILQQFPFAKEGVCIVLENGKLNRGACRLSALPAGMEILTLAEAKNNPDVLAHYNRYADVQEDAFSALNTAFANDGLVLLIHPRARIDTPVYIIHVSSSGGQAVISHSRLLVIAAQHASAKISHVSVSATEGTETFSNAIIEVYTGENASLEFDLLQNENEKSFRICGTHVYQAANSVFSINTIALGGRILKNKLHIKLDGLNCETHMHGLYVAGGAQLIDNHTAVYHSKPHCNSNELYKGIIGGKAHGVFNGKIFVEKDAQKTNAYQSNKNILLSNDAVVNAKPQLEIFADDVKCTHGATTGQMDDESLFYLRSRGINENDAKALLNLAFANDILNNISLENFREYISTLVESKLKAVAY